MYSTSQQLPFLRRVSPLLLHHPTPKQSRVRVAGYCNYSGRAPKTVADGSDSAHCQWH